MTNKYVIINTKSEATFDNPLATPDTYQYKADTLKEAIHLRDRATFSGAAEGVYGEWTIYEEVHDPDSRATKLACKILDWLDQKAKCDY